VTDGRLRRLSLDGDDAVLVAAAVLVLAGFTLAEHQIAGRVGLPLDDGWIHLRVATNLARGHGFGVNPGEPVAVSTAPLWTLSLAGAISLGVPGLLAAKALGVAAYLATALLTRRAALGAGAGRGSALAAGLAAVGLGRLAWGALSGMEVPLAAALVAATVVSVLRGRPGIASIALGLATLARPEAGLLIPFHALGARRLRAAIGRVAVAGLILLPAVAFNLRTVGWIVPSTAIAKVEGGLLGHTEGLGGAWRVGLTRAPAYLVEWIRLLFADHAALPVLGLVGLVVARRGALRWLGLVLVLHPLAVGLLAPYRGPAFQTGRYSSHLLPLALVLAAVGLHAVLTEIQRRGWPGRAVLIVGLGLGLGLGVGTWPAARSYAWGVQNIEAMQVTLGRWVATETAPDAVLAVNDIGALSYFGNRRILDLMGLATPSLLPYRRQGQAGIVRYVESRCPDYLVIFPDWFPELVARTDLLDPITRVQLSHNEVAGAAEMVVYDTVWRRDRAGRLPCGHARAQVTRASPVLPARTIPFMSPSV
jgi:hypothetical protein